MTDSATVPTWDHLWGQTVVLDLESQFVYVGQLVKQELEYLVLRNADAHDLRDTPTTTREQYLLQCRRHGVVPNREWVWVSTRQIVAVSRLEDVAVC